MEIVLISAHNFGKLKPKNISTTYLVGSFSVTIAIHIVESAKQVDSHQLGVGGLENRVQPGFSLFNQVERGLYRVSVSVTPVERK